MLTLKQIKEMGNGEIIRNICYNSFSETKAAEKELVFLYKELERRGIVDDWEVAYKMISF